MKINKRLTINNEVRSLVSEEISLSLNWAGKARFVVEGGEKATGKVNFLIGYAHLETLHHYFSGIVDSCEEVAKGKWQIIAREYIAALDDVLPISLRHVTLKEVLAKVSTITGIKFVIPNKQYAMQKVPYFYHTGTATQQLQSLGDVFSIPDYIWFQQGDGTCFIGSHADSFWKDKQINTLTSQVIEIDGQSIKLPILPAAKPGVLINGKRILRITTEGSRMIAQW